MSSSFTPQTTGLKITLDEQEKRVFGQLFKQSDPDGFGIVTGDIARTLFERSGLPASKLGMIWQAADYENNGFLDQTGFSIALRLIGHVQNGVRALPSRDLANYPGPLPVFDGKKRDTPGVATSPSIVSPDPIRNTPSAVVSSNTGNDGNRGASHPVPILTPAARQRYVALFNKSAPGGEMPGEKARDIFLKARLGTDTLGEIWNLADTQNRGCLNQTEFVIAMHLIQTTLDGSLKTVPTSLPASLHEAALGRPTSNASLRSPPNGIAVPNQVPLQRATTQSPVQYAAYHSLKEWTITPQERARFNGIFDSLDVDKTGTIGPDKVAPFLSTSGLSEDVLANIWDLSDLNNNGEFTKSEFSIAMYLVQQKLAGNSLPSSLPQSLIDSARPSSRQSSLVNAGGVNSPNPIFFGATSPPPQQARAASAASAAPKGAMSDLAFLGDIFSSPLPPTEQKTDEAVALQPQKIRAKKQPESQPIAQAQTFETQTKQATSPPQPLQSQPLQSQPTQSDTKLRQFVPTSTFGQSILAESEDAKPDAQTEANKGVLSAEMADISNQISDLNTKTTSIIGQKDSYQGELTRAQAQKNEIAAKLSSLKAAYDQEAKNVHNAKQSLVQTQGELTNLTQEYSLIEASYNAITSQHQQAAQELEAKKEEVSAIQQKIDSMKEETAAIQKQIEEIEKEHKRQKELAEDNQKKLREAEEERERLQAELKASQEKVSASTRELEPATSSLPSYSTESTSVGGATGAIAGAVTGVAAAVVGSSVFSNESDDKDKPKDGTNTLSDVAPVGDFEKNQLDHGNVSRITSVSPGNPFSNVNTSATLTDGFIEDTTKGDHEILSAPQPTSTKGEKQFEEMFHQMDIGSPSTSYPARSSTHGTEVTPGSTPPLSDFAGPSTAPAFTLPIYRPGSTTSSVQNNAPLSVRGDIDTPGQESAAFISGDSGEHTSHTEVESEQLDAGEAQLPIEGSLEQSPGENSILSEKPEDRNLEATVPDVSDGDHTESAALETTEQPVALREPHSTPESYEFVEHEDSQKEDASQTGQTAVPGDVSLATAPSDLANLSSSVPGSFPDDVPGSFPDDVPSSFPVNIPESELRSDISVPNESVPFDIPESEPKSDISASKESIPMMNKSNEFSKSSVNEEFPPIKDLDVDNDEDSSSSDEELYGSTDHKDDGEERFLTPTSTHEETGKGTAENLMTQDKTVFPQASSSAVDSTSFANAVPANGVTQNPDDFFSDAFVGLSEAKVDNDPNDSFDNDGSYDFRGFSDFTRPEDDTFTSVHDSSAAAAGAAALGQPSNGTTDSVNDEWEELFAGLGNNSAATAAQEVEDDQLDEIDDAFTVKNVPRETSPHSQAVAQLVGMGFSKDASLQALSKHGYDLGQATNYLLDNSRS